MAQAFCFEDLSDQDLCRLATERGPEAERAEATLIQRHEPLVRSIVSKLNVRSHHREDALQEGRLALLLSIRRFNATRGVKLSTFAARRIGGQIIDSIFTDRDAPAEICVESFPDESIEDQALENADARLDLLTYVETLGKTDQWIATSLFVQDFTSSSIAKQLGVSTSAIAQRRTRILTGGRDAMTLSAA